MCISEGGVKGRNKSCDAVVLLTRSTLSGEAVTFGALHVRSKSTGGRIVRPRPLLYCLKWVSGDLGVKLGTSRFLLVAGEAEI